MNRLSLLSIRRRPKKLPQRRGAAAAELAATLPLIILLFLAACDLGRFGHAHSAVINSARVGAGQGILNRPTANGQSRWAAEIHRAVVDELSGLNGFDPERLSVSSTCVRETGGVQRVSVEVTYQFQTVVTWGVIPHELPLRQTCVLRML